MVRKKKSLQVQNKDVQFNQCLDFELQLASNIDISDAELIFFAALCHHHYFIMCLNFKKRVVQVLDNKTLGKGVNFVSRYENCDQILVEAFKNYCKFKGIKTLLNKMTKNEDGDDVFKHELVKMYWKNISNVTDCEICCMRHMETFKGIGPNWDSRFNITTADDLFLTSLRAKYAVDIIFINE
nr:uncharacterized protein LOC109150823 [Ipomoea batatas]